MVALAGPVPLRVGVEIGEGEVGVEPVMTGVTSAAQTPPSSVSLSQSSSTLLQVSVAPG